MKNKARAILAVLLFQLPLFPLVSQEASKNPVITNDLDEDFSLSMFTLKGVFMQQDDGGLNIKDVFISVFSIMAAIAAAFGTYNLVIYLIGRKSRKLLEAKFNAIKKIAARTKLDFISEADFSSLIEKAFELSKKTDKHTGRKYTNQLPVLVYGISIKMGEGQKNAAMHFLSSLVYDVGFLDIPSELFFGEILNRKEKMIFKKHTICFDNKIPDMPQELFIECYEACSCHHENYDGTGYPEGLSGGQIPLIARILRVVESYLSLISKGTYHKGLSKKKAIKDLKSRDGIYDGAIIDILEDLV